MRNRAPAPADARGSILFVAGPTDSGKSRHMWDRYTSHAPRILTVEVVEETAAREDGTREVFETFGYDDTRDALARAAARDRWHVVASLDRDDVERLFFLLCPPRRAKDTISFARAVGGMVLHCGELAHVAPLGLGKNSIVKDAYLRHRHQWLTIHGAAQHAADCDPCTRMYAERCVFLRTQDDLGLQAVARATSAVVAQLVAELPLYHSATCIKREGRVYLADEDYRVYDVKGYRGAALSPLSEGAPGSAGVSTTARGNGRHSVRSLPVETR
jgi:hypothetical protein